jgi:putative glycosyltransferase
MTAVRLSIVTSMYKSAPFLEEFYARCAATAAKLTDNFEIIVVNDGSPDESLELALDLRRRDPRVRVVDLSRNFGHHKALMTGLARARGELVFLLDCDLEEEPEWLASFHEEMTKTNADVVYGVQEARKGSWFERVSGQMFFGLFNHMLSHPIPANVATVRLMSRRYVRALVSHQDRELCLAGLWVITGFDQRPHTIRKHARRHSSYTFRKRVSVFVNAITSFSNRPLIYIFQIGLAVMALSIAAAAVLVYRRVTGRVGVPGWASIMVSIWFLGGLTIFSIGVIGVYLAKVFTETKPRPYTVIRADHGGDVDEP